MLLSNTLKVMFFCFFFSTGSQEAQFCSRRFSFSVHIIFQTHYVVKIIFGCQAVWMPTVNMIIPRQEVVIIFSLMTSVIDEGENIPTGDKVKAGIMRRVLIQNQSGCCVRGFFFFFNLIAVKEKDTDT